MSALPSPAPLWGGGFSGKFAMLLGYPATTNVEAELAHAFPLRLDIALLDNLLKEGLTSKELAMVLPPRTLAHRRAKGQPLSPDESDRALRVARLVALAESVFDDGEKALRWLRKPQTRFFQRSAMALMASEVGGRLVEETLVQIDEGYAA
jgi:putative toxin-antitoxin system antitoxin component (TIGR02293 family)